MENWRTWNWYLLGGIAMLAVSSIASYFVRDIGTGLAMAGGFCIGLGLARR
jgi:hypothetical protein